METHDAKRALRKAMAARKKEYPATVLQERSDKILERLEQTAWFQAAQCIAFYHAIPGEVQTARFIDRWYRKKRILLPLIVGDDLRLLLYEGPDSLCQGPFGIMEPKADGVELPEQEIDLIVVPGVAFDAHCHRMGRGRGFYDRLLATQRAHKIGICFQFQLLPEVPTEPFDQPMDMVVTENDIYK